MLRDVKFKSIFLKMYAFCDVLLNFINHKSMYVHINIYYLYYYVYLFILCMYIQENFHYIYICSMTIYL